MVMIMEQSPLVYIIVLCHNSKMWLDQCIVSLINTDYNNYKIVLVDNCSIDGSVNKIKLQFPKIIIIKNNKNVGWCKGNNVGIKRALGDGAEFVVLLNSDIRAEQKEWLSNLVNFSNSHPQYSILGCVQYEYNSIGWLKPNSWTKYILSNGNKDVLSMWDLEYSEDANTKVYTEEDLKKKDFLDCYFVQGAAMMIRSKVFEKIGLLDEIYFIFYDEIDFSRKARMIGEETALVTSSRIKHVGSGDNSSNKKTKKRRNFYFSRNKYIFLFTDTERKFNRLLKMSIKLLKYDIKDAFGKKQDISGSMQLLNILLSLVLKIPQIIRKRKRDKGGAIKNKGLP